MKKNQLCFLASIVLVLSLSSCMTISTEVNSPVNNEEGNITIEVKKVIQKKGLSSRIALRVLLFSSEQTFRS